MRVLGRGLNTRAVATSSGSSPCRLAYGFSITPGSLPVLERKVRERTRPRKKKRVGTIEYSHAPILSRSLEFFRSTSFNIKNREINNLAFY